MKQKDIYFFPVVVIITILFNFYFIFVCHASLIQMRVVKETANFGNYRDLDSANPLIPSVPPANFSGPKLLRRLIGKCFNSTEDRYRYTFCPFQSFIQYEISQRWNAYQGILGIWSHWQFENNTFSAMIHTHGESCGEINRSVKIFIECGTKDVLMNVTEPTRCQYSAVFQTKYACHPDALLLYPRLSPALQKEWDVLATELHYDHITQKGYDKSLKDILSKAGLGEPKPSIEEAKIAKSTSEHPFADLQFCNQEYNKLQNEIKRLNTEVEALKVILDLNRITNKTQKHR